MLVTAFWELKHATLEIYDLIFAVHSLSSQGNWLPFLHSYILFYVHLLFGLNYLLKLSASLQNSKDYNYFQLYS